MNEMHLIPKYAQATRRVQRKTTEVDTMRRMIHTVLTSPPTKRNQTSFDFCGTSTPSLFHQYQLAFFDPLGVSTSSLPRPSKSPNSSLPIFSNLSPRRVAFSERVDEVEDGREASVVGLPADAERGALRGWYGGELGLEEVLYDEGEEMVDCVCWGESRAASSASSCARRDDREPFVPLDSATPSPFAPSFLFELVEASDRLPETVSIGWRSAAPAATAAGPY